MTANSTLSTDIAADLRAEILRGRYLAGERLPSERDLSAHFGASRGAVREALSELKQLGLIDIQLGGARVKALKDARIAVLGPLLAASEVIDPELIRQFLQTFGALAVVTAEEAVERADEAQLNRLQDMVVSLNEHTDDHLKQRETWRELFLYLSEVADNLVVQLIGNDLKALFADQIVRLGLEPTFRKRVKSQILSGLKQGINKRDKSKVADAIKLYFEELSLTLQQELAERLPERLPKYQSQAN